MLRVAREQRGVREHHHAALRGAGEGVDMLDAEMVEHRATAASEPTPSK